MTTFGKYIKEPFLLLVKNKTIFMLFFVFLVINHFSDSLSKLKVEINPEYVFSKFLSDLTVLLRNPLFLALIVFFFIIKSLLIVSIGKDLYFIFTRQRRSLGNSLSQITSDNFSWFLKTEISVYIVFGCIAGVCYVFCFFLWNTFQLQIFSLVLLGLFFIFFFPLFYISISLASTLSAVPLSSEKRYQKFFSFSKNPVLKKTYLFYAVRLSLEYIFLFGLPFVFVFLFPNKLLASFFLLIGLLLPLLILRGSAYEFKLEMLKNDPDFQDIFKKHYIRN